jgi:hypothetical protein
MLKTEYSQRHGGPYDRGAADSYYRRDFYPHYFVGATYSSPRVIVGPGTPEWEAYCAGYSDNEASGSHKY